MKNNNYVLTTLSVIFVGMLMMSNILANHMLQFGPWAIDAGTLTFPITYILSDVFSEVYGYRCSRRVSWMAAGMTLTFSLLIMLSVVLPQPEWYDGSHFKLALGGSIRIVFASVTAMMLGDFANDNLFRVMKRASGEGFAGFKSRAITSSALGNTVDTTWFVFAAFFGTMPVEEMFPMIGISVVLKTGYEALILPITERVARVVQRLEGTK